MHKGRRAAAMVLAAALLIGTAGCGSTKVQEPAKPAAAAPVQPTYTEKAQTVRKAETVYVNLDNSGKILATSVTDWLHTDKGEVYVPDESDLENICDIKGNTQPRKENGGMVWDMQTTDLYYRGTTEKKPPVEFSIEYTLDGKAITPEKLAGKSGKVQVTVHMKNTCEKDGVYLPVIGAGLMILPEGVFSGIEVENGITVGDGAKQIIVGVGVPGMAESLGLTGEAKLGSIRIGSDFTVTADADGFALENLYFAVLPICSMDLTTLVPGSEEEAAQVLGQIESILKALGSLDTEKLLNALTGDTLTELGTMITEAVDVYKKNEALLTVLSKYMTKENIDGISTLLTALQDEKTAEMLERLNNPLVKNMLSGLPELLEAVQTLTPTLESLQEDLQDPQVRAALDDLPQTLETLSKLQNVLEKNSALLETVGELANDDLIGAVETLAQTTDAQTVVTDITARAGELLPQLKAYIAYGKEYGVFTKAAEGTDVSLLFIYMTPSLHEHPIEATEPATAPEPWYKKIF